MSRPETLRSLVALALLLGSVGCATGETPPAAADEPAPEAEAVSTLEIRNQAAPAPGILTAGQPTEQQLLQAAAEGYRTVINLRTAGEDGELAGEEEIVRAAGMNYVLLPIGGADGITVENAQKLADALAAPEAMPAIVHCASSNRVGALLALKAFNLDGASRDEALALGKSAGMTRLEPTVVELLNREH